MYFSCLELMAAPEPAWWWSQWSQPTGPATLHPWELQLSFPAWLGHRTRASFTQRLVWWKGQVCWQAFCIWKKARVEKKNAPGDEVTLSSLPVLLITSELLTQTKGRQVFLPHLVLGFSGGEVVGLDGYILLFWFSFQMTEQSKLSLRLRGTSF